jgi:hypothetical protein
MAAVPRGAIDGFGTLGIDAPGFSGAGSFTATQTYYLTSAGLAGNLDLGLVNGATLIGFASGTLTVSVDGVNALTTNFGPSTLNGSATSTASYFTDNVIDLGSFSGDIFTVTLQDTSGLLAIATSAQTTATSDDAAFKITGIQSTSMTLTGSLAAVNAALAGLADTDASTGSDMIDITTSDTNGGTPADASIAVTVNAPPVITTPVNRVSIAVDEPTILQRLNADESEVVPISLSEVGMVAPGELFQVTVTDSDGILSDADSAVTYVGSDLTGIDQPLTFDGSLSDVNAALAQLEATNVAAGMITVSAVDLFGNSAVKQSFNFTVSDTPAELAALTPAQIAALGTAGLTTLSVGGAGVITPAQADAFIAAGIFVSSSLGTTLLVSPVR